MHDKKWTLSDLIVGLAVGMLMLALLGISLPRDDLLILGRLVAAII